MSHEERVALLESRTKPARAVVATESVTVSA